MTQWCWAPRQIAQFKRLYAEGYSARYILEHMGLTAGSVPASKLIYYRRRLGLPPRFCSNHPRDRLVRERAKKQLRMRLEGPRRIEHLTIEIQFLKDRIRRLEHEKKETLSAMEGGA